MQRFNDWLLTEMPINKFQLVGDWGPTSPKRGWDQKSIGILTNEKGVQKIRNMWNKVEVDFDMYFVRQQNAAQHLETGQVDSAWLKENLGIDLQPNPDAITVLFTQNRAGEQVPMTAWTIGHRFGHAIESSRKQNTYASQLYQNFSQEVRNALSKLFKEVYKKEITKFQKFMPSSSEIEAEQAAQNKLKLISQAVGTMKSARSNSIRNFNEFIHELFGQYILTGVITFQYPEGNLGAKYAWGNKYHQYYNRVNDEQQKDDIKGWLENLGHQFSALCEEILWAAVGNIYVM